MELSLQELLSFAAWPSSSTGSKLSGCNEKRQEQLSYFCEKA